MKRLFFTFFLTINIFCNYDLTIVGQMKFAESLPRLSILLIDGLKNDLKINYVNTNGWFDLTDVPKDIKKIASNRDKKVGKVSLFVDVLWLNNSNPSIYLPNSHIKIAYSMIESSRIPKQWVNILNARFDMVVVPDEYFIEVYKDSGVKIPIFVIPHPMYLEDFLNTPLKHKKSTPFVFGMSAAFNERKNYEMLIMAFVTKFANNKNVKLVLHGRAGSTYPEVVKLLKRNNLSNISLLTGNISKHEYKKFLSSIDCYVLLSKGEGFSLTPREALALGIPCIITNNTAHKTICQSGFVKAIKSNIEEDANYPWFNGTIGKQFNCCYQDVIDALTDVYTNYTEYLNKAHAARDWVKQYEYKKISKLFLTLIKPTKVVFGDSNEISESTITTNSRTLYEKYMH